MRHFSETGVPIPAGLFRTLSALATIQESIGSSSQASTLRAQARLAQKPRYTAQARLVDSDDLGARDASPSVARLTDADDVPLDSFKSDLRRKVALKQVMPASEDEGLIDDHDDDEERGECHDEMGFVVDCSHPDAVDATERLSERDPRRSIAQLGMTPLGDQRDEEPEPRSGQVSKEDVNYRYDSTGQQPCQSCRNFRGPSGCVLVAGLIRATDTCDMFQPIHKAALKVYGR